MTEAKWWPQGVVPNVNGVFVSARGGLGNRALWKFPEERVMAIKSDHAAERAFHGPIPDPTPEPPKLRRFTAKYRKSGRDVSGVQMEGREIVSTFSRDTGDSGCWSSGCELDELIITEWLDPE
jgi:hypothetical protein